MSTADGKRRRITRSSVIVCSQTRHEEAPMTVDLCSTPDELPSCIDLTSDEPDDVVELPSSNDTSVVCLGAVSSNPSAPRRRGRKRQSPVLAGSVPNRQLRNEIENDTLPDLASTSSDCNLSQDEHDVQQKKECVCCPICFDRVKVIQETKRQLTSTICGHIFCSTCISEAIRTSHACPKCRKKLTQKQYHPIFI